MNPSLTIDVIANDGSPLGVSEASIHGLDGRVGVGGAELAILTLMGEWKKAGHHVRFYNNPLHHGDSSFHQYPISMFSPQEYRDILIIFRSPNRRAVHAKAGKKVWLSTDQYTVGDFAEFSKHVDKIVTISDFHSTYFSQKYSINNSIVIDLPVRVGEYTEPVEKVKNRMIYCSVPTRGLDILAKCYPRIQQEVPDVSLTITSDFRLWGASTAMNEKYLRQFMGKPGVQFLGAIPRKSMIIEQQKAEIHPYSCTYDELFCYSVAECQVAGCIPITSGVGALATTNMGKLIIGDPNSGDWQDKFVAAVVNEMQNRNTLQERAEESKQQAIKRFSPERILKEWDEKVFYG